VTRRYDEDVILWAEEQARLLRARRFDELDIEHVADEIEDVGKSELAISGAGWPCCSRIF